MSVYHTLCFLSAAAMVIAFVNSKIGKMQTTIAITAGSMILSLLILIAGQNDWFHLTEIATETVTSINFEDFLLKGILGFLLLPVVWGSNSLTSKTKSGRSPYSL